MELLPPFSPESEKSRKLSPALTKKLILTALLPVILNVAKDLNLLTVRFGAALGITIPGATEFGPNW